MKIDWFLNHSFFCPFFVLFKRVLICLVVCLTIIYDIYIYIYIYSLLHYTYLYMICTLHVNTQKSSTYCIIYQLYPYYILYI